VMSLSVCLCAICRSVCEHISQTTPPNFTKFSVRPGSVLLWRRCNTLCTSGFLNDVSSSAYVVASLLRGTDCILFWKTADVNCRRVLVQGTAGRGGVCYAQLLTLSARWEERSMTAVHLLIICNVTTRQFCTNYTANFNWSPVLECGREGNRRSDVAMTLRHRFQWFISTDGGKT